MPFKNYAPLTTFSPAAEMKYLQAPALAVVAHWDDPAKQALIDFKYTPAETISSDETIDTALILIRASAYKVFLVLDQEQRIIGLLGANDLLGEKPLKIIQDHRIARADISVQMLMQPVGEIIAIDVENLRHAKVGQVVSTLQAHKQHYALAVKVDAAGMPPLVRGLFSLPQIARQIGVDTIGDTLGAQSIAELQHDVGLNK